MLGPVEKRGRFCLKAGRAIFAAFKALLLKR